MVLMVSMFAVTITTALIAWISRAMERRGWL